MSEVRLVDPSVERRRSDVLHDRYVLRTPPLKVSYTPGTRGANAED